MGNLEVGRGVWACWEEGRRFGYVISAIYVGAWHESLEIIIKTPRRASKRHEYIFFLALISRIAPV